MMTKILVVLLFCILSLVNISQAMTRAQIKQAGKLMRNVCQPKFKLANDQVENIKNGEFIDNEDVKCYISCVFTMAQTVKNGKLNYESALKQIDMMLPENMKDGAKQALKDCKPIIDSAKELCQSSFDMAKCIYTANPEVFVFP